MKFFNFGKKDKILDLTERYKKQQERTATSGNDFHQVSQPSQEIPSQSPLGFLGNFASVGASQTDSQEGEDEKKRRLAKRFVDLTNRMEELSNQIYRLQQRVELLEKKVK